MPVHDHSELQELRWAFGDRLRHLRQAAGLTQAELGRRAGGIDHKTISRIENGHHAPSLDRIALLASGLGIPMDQLFTGLPLPHPPQNAE